VNHSRLTSARPNHVETLTRGQERNGRRRRMQRKMEMRRRRMMMNQIRIVSVICSPVNTPVFYIIQFNIYICALLLVFLALLT